MDDATDSQCLERGNSTDCLLRLLLQTLSEKSVAEDGKFDWDPITFAFTVVIGLFAAIFALVTIYQATLAAGPGRRKCNRRAICYWATKTRKEWSWNDFNRLSIATTPVLRADYVHSYLSLHEFREEDDIVEGHHRKLGNPPLHTSAATWVRFLHHLGLESLPSIRDFGDVTVTTADYLTNDLLAVPAYADLGFIVAAAAAAGAHTFSTVQDPGGQSPYPTITGDDFQFDFRQHPTLGTIGAFSHYGASPADSRKAREIVSQPSAIQKLLLVIQHSSGNVNHAALPGFGKPPFSPIRLIRSVAQITPFDEINHDPIIHDKASDGLPCIGDAYHLDTHGLSWLLMMRTPPHMPAIFPGTLSRRNGNVLAMLSLNGRFWLGSTDHGSSTSSESMYRIMTPKIGAVYVSWIDEKMSEMEIDLTTLESTQKQLWNPLPGTFLFTEVIDQTRSILNDYDDFHSWFVSLDLIRRRFFRVRLLLHIQQLDRVLEMTAEKNDVSARTCRILYTTLMLLDVEQAFSDGAFQGPALSGVDEGDAKPGQPRNLGQERALSSLHPVKRYSRTLGIIRTILDDLPDFGIENLFSTLDADGYIPYMEILEISQQIQSHRHSKEIFVLGGETKHFRTDTSPFIQQLAKRFDVLRAFMRVVDTRGSEPPTIGGGVAGLSGRSTPRKPVDTRPDSRPQVIDIDDIIIWRAVLIAVLFWTALDSSAIMTSGLWKHVVPII